MHTHTHDKDVLLAYLDFTAAFPSADHTQLTRILGFLGIPEDFIIIVSNLYFDAHTKFLTPHGWTRLLQILRGMIQGDSLSPLIFILLVEPLIRWIKSTQKGYTLTSNNLSLTSKWYADDATLVAATIPALISQLQIVEKFSNWSGIHMNIPKCRLTGYIHKLQTIKSKKDRDTALQTT